MGTLNHYLYFTLVASHGEKLSSVPESSQRIVHCSLRGGRKRSLCNENPKRYRYISVSLTGRAVASWSTHDGIRNMHLNNSSEYYVIQSISLWDNEDDSTADHQLPPGEHTFLSASR